MSGGPLFRKQEPPHADSRPLRAASERNRQRAGDGAAGHLDSPVRSDPGAMTRRFEPVGTPAVGRTRERAATDYAQDLDERFPGSARAVDHDGPSGPRNSEAALGWRLLSRDSKRADEDAFGRWRAISAYACPRPLRRGPSRAGAVLASPTFRAKEEASPDAKRLVHGSKEVRDKARIAGRQEHPRLRRASGPRWWAIPEATGSPTVERASL
jgi:hypothetical protein